MMPAFLVPGAVLSWGGIDLNPFQTAEGSGFMGYATMLTHRTDWLALYDAECAAAAP